MNIAKAIAELRTGKRLSQEELAAKLFVSRDLVSKWETGARRPDWQMIERIAEVLDVSPSRIVNKNDLVLKELSACLPKNVRLSTDELAQVLTAFLERLPGTEADLFISRYYFLKNVAEIAAVFSIGSNHVRSLLSRTRKKLKNYIQEVENGKPETV